MRNLLLLSVALIFSASAVFAQNQAEILDQGDGNTALIFQHGLADFAHITQSETSSDNFAEITQHGTDADFPNEAIIIQHGETGEAFILQIGTDNYAQIQQWAEDNFAEIHQDGDNNQATIVQLGNGDSFSVVQIGNDGFAHIVQDGDNSNFTVIDTGNDNTINISQVGDWQFAFVEVHGDENFVQVDQNHGTATDFASRNDVDILVDGDLNTVTTSQVGDTNRIEAFSAFPVWHSTRGVNVLGNENFVQIQQNSTHASGERVASVIQDGELNSAVITQYGTDVIAGIRQVGDENMATITQTEHGSDNGALIHQVGDENTATITQTGSGGASIIFQGP